MSNWPIGNRPDSLQIDWFYINRQVGNYLGYGYNRANHDDEQREAVQEIIDEGVRQYYFPPPLPAHYSASSEPFVHEWSWMRPVYPMTTQANQRRYPLPDTFERPIGRLSYTDTQNNFYAPIPWTSASRLRQLEYQSNFTTYPQYAAYEPAESSGDGPQLQILVLHPTPDSEYELSFQYQAIAKRLTEEHPYPLGGQIHGRGFLQSCLAAAEMRRQGAEGPMHMKFMEILAGNIARDYQRGAALLGYNGNVRDIVNARGSLRAMGGLYYQDVTYGGVLYTGD